MNWIGSFSDSLFCQLQVFLELTFWNSYICTVTLTSTMEGKTRMLILKAVFTTKSMAYKTGFSRLLWPSALITQRSHDHLATKVWWGVCPAPAKEILPLGDSYFILCFYSQPWNSESARSHIGSVILSQRWGYLYSHGRDAWCSKSFDLKSFKWDTSSNLIAWRLSFSWVGLRKWIS